MTEIAIRQDSDTGAFNPDDEQILNYLGLNPRDPKSRAVVAVSQRYNLDPVLKHVIVIPKGGAYITRDGYLHIAHRSGKLDGIVVEEDPHIVDGEWRCRVSVYRKDMRFPFTFPGRYSVQGSNRQYAQEMALKVAESHALRRAFDIAGLPSYDEHMAEVNTTSAPPPQQATAADFIEAEPVVQAEPEPDAPAPKPMTKRTQGQLFALFGQKGIAEDQQLAGINYRVGGTYTSRADVTEDDARLVIDYLKSLDDAEATTETEGGESNG